MYINIIVLGLDNLLYYYFPYSYGLLRFTVRIVFGISYYTVIPVSKLLYNSGKTIYNYSLEQKKTKI